MINLIIDAANEKIVFMIIADKQSYTSKHINSRENFDNFMKLLLKFLNIKKIKISDIHRIFVNLGPGKFTSLRISLSVSKAICLVNSAVLIGFRSRDLINKNYKNLIKLDKNKSFVLEKIFPKSERYILTFVISILIIAGLSWVLVESAIEISAILKIPEAIVALTVLAIGTSVPDTISSVIVAKQGRGGMAISNAIGSNIFDILFGLGIPWLIVLAINGGTIPVSTENLYSSVVLLFATVFVIFFLFLLRRWHIGNKSGYFLILLYIAYLVWSVSTL